MDGEYSGAASSSSAELHYLIAKFLCGGPCSDIGEALKCKLESRKILPKRVAWTGEEQEQTFDELDSKFSHLDGDHLLNICQRLGPLLSKDLSSILQNDQVLRGIGAGSLLQPLCAEAKRRSLIYLYSRMCQTPDSVHHKQRRNLVQLVHGRENSTQLLKSRVRQSDMYLRLHQSCRPLGHLSAVYCVLFDRSSRYIITGADDMLVKIWDAHSGRLLATLRGASMEITDMDINPENTLLAAGCLDKIVRVWCLQTTAPVAVLSAHSGMITSVKWCPYPETGDFRFLMSTSADGSVAFWTYTHHTLGKNVKFNPKPIQYHEKMRPGQAQIICASFSPGGVFLAAASADHHVRVYLMIGDEGPTRIFEKEVHTDRVDSIQWASTGLRFASGSKDGTALIWRFEANEWHHLLLDMQKRLDEPTEEEAKLKLKVTMVAWTMNDQNVITAVSDFSLRVWDSSTGKLLHCLKEHKNDIFVLEKHPFCSNLLLSAGHDGQIILWDLAQNKVIKSFLNTIQGQGYGAVYDVKWSPDGLMAAATDSHGHLLIFCIGENTLHKKLPNDLFFHTDYRPLVRDSNHWVLDEQTQMAPHLMPPPFLVDIDGNPYPPLLQRLVPGRAKHKDEQLVPNLIVNEEGEREVQDQAQARSNIDEMIEELAARQNGGPSNNDHAYARSPSGQQQNRLAVRRSGDVEGVRQSGGNWQRGSDCSVWLKKDLVPLPSKTEELTIQKKSASLGKLELKDYYDECSKQPLKAKTVSPQVLKVKSKSPRKQPPSRPRPQQENSSGNPHSYRTRTSRLGDDFVDPESLSVTSSNRSDSDSSDSSNESSSNSSDSSEYSDWVADNSSNKQATLQAPKRSRRRRVVLRRSSKEDNEEESEEEEEEQHSEPSESPEPGPSQVKRDSRLRQAPKKTSRHEDASPPRVVKNSATAKLLSSDMKEVPEQYKPSDWLSEVIPRKTPYFPQIGDEVVYFRQGHQNYLNVTRSKELYDPGARCEPWLKKDLREVEYVRIVGIKYEIRPPRLCCLRLAIVDPVTGAFSSYFNIKYHDIPDVIDFLVLRQYYDAAMDKNWKVGEQFRCLIDDSWWIGTIEAQNAVDLDFPDSPFQCFQVRWDNGETERMSPWDLETVDQSRIPAEKGGSVEVLQEEIQASLYQSMDPESWPPSGDRDIECHRFMEGIEKVMDLSVAEPFLAPVDLNLYPSYALLIAYPVDLTTIKTRLENRFYRSIQALQFDVRYVASNAEKYNQRSSLIVKQANIVTDLCLKITTENGQIDIMAEYHRLGDNYKSESSEPEEDEKEQDGGSSCRRSSRKSSKNEKSLRVQRPRRSSNVLKVDPDEWKEKCSDLVHQLWQSRDSEPFREPVDLLLHKDYTKSVDTPMDLGTVREQLEAGNYDSPLEFAKDVRLIFANSKNFNTNKKSKIYAMTVRLSNLFESGFHPVLNDWRTQQRSSPNKLPNGSTTKATRSTAQAKIPPKSDSSSSSSSSISTSRSAVVANGATRRLKISSDSDGSGSTRPTRSSVKPALSPDASSSNSLPSSSSSRIANGSSRRAATRQKPAAKINSSSSDDEDDVDVGGSSPSESRPESANQAVKEEADDDDDDDSSEESEDESEEEDYSSRSKSKRPSRAAAKKRPQKFSDSDSSVEPSKRPKRATPVKKPTSNRNQRQRKAVSYQEMSEDEYKNRKSTRTSKRNCIQSDSAEEDEEDDDDDDDQQTVSVSSRGRIRKLTEKARGLFD